MPDYFAECALLPTGWARNVRLTVDAGGTLAAVEPEAGADGAERLKGIALPGMPNLHSHAFQRAMAGLAEHLGGTPGEDSFWTWREAMYGFVARITPDDLHAIASHLYVEMLKAGYTAVGEFHYLHNEPSGRAYADPATLSDSIIAAARTSGIGLTHLPALYMAGGFGNRPVEPAQRRFRLDVDAFLSLVRDLRSRTARDPQLRIGIAPHSLRAVPDRALAECLDGLNAIDPTAPVHIHVAEQTKEVEECLAWSGARPVEYLLSIAPVDTQWCLIHATHMVRAETEAVAERGAVVGLCPTTEANLGDGLFPLPDYLRIDGRFGIGSDSHISVDPLEELRWLEYGQRLVYRRRNIAARAAGTTSTGATLFRRAVSGGAQALGRPIGALAPGRRADLVVIDRSDPLLADRSVDRVLDCLVFAGTPRLVRDVMVGGRWVVRDGHHAAEEAVARSYREALARLEA